MQPCAVIGSRRDAHLCLCVLRRVKAELKQIRPALFHTLLLPVLLKILPDLEVHLCCWVANLHTFLLQLIRIRATFLAILRTGCSCWPLAVVDSWEPVPGLPPLGLVGLILGSTFCSAG